MSTLPGRKYPGFYELEYSIGKGLIGRLSRMAGVDEMRINGTHKSQAGFSLVELMIVVMIVAIIGVIGGPVMIDTVKNNRVRAQADRILTTLNLTRSEAVKRNLPVSVCRSSNGTSCTGNWADGWIVFTNADADNTVDAGVDQVIRVYEGLNAGYTLGGTLDGNSLTYFGDGSYAGGAGTINICSPDADPNRGWALMLNTVGRPRAKQGATSCS
jgi:type IV fimbrial biogenesis protein FimT